MNRSPASEGIVILGATVMGTTLAHVLASAGKPVTLWCESPERTRAETKADLGQTVLTSDLAEAVAGGTLLLPAVGSQRMAATVQSMKALVHRGHVVLSVTKGFDLPSLRTMSQLFAAELAAGAVGAVSGPNMMADLLAGQPAGIVVASSRSEATEKAAGLLGCQQLFVYANDDLVGVELAGALKNVVVVAVGIAAGLGYMANVCAWVLARAVAEMTHLSTTLGARPDTFRGLTGIGDLYLTSTSPDSVNRKVGVELGRGKRLADVFPDPAALPESVHTLRATRRLIEASHLDLPIAKAAAAILEGEAPPSAILSAVAGYAAHDIDRDPKRVSSEGPE
jgi:glycerol-3-phosphate dehydrogenase (NAD(P)+)